MGATLLELALASSAQHWSLQGKNRLVKVVNTYAHREMTHKYKNTVMGYVTQARFLYNKAIDQIESGLGLRPGELGYQAYVVTLAKIPKLSTVEYRFFASFIAGKWYDDAAHADLLAKRDRADSGAGAFNRSLTPVRDFYVPGDHRIPQWELMVPVPVASAFPITKSVPFQEVLG